MATRWHRRHCDPGAVLLVDERLVGQVARYDRCSSPGSVDKVGYFYVGFVRGDRVTGEVDTLSLAQELVEAQALPR